MVIVEGLNSTKSQVFPLNVFIFQVSVAEKAIEQFSDDLTIAFRDYETFEEKQGMSLFQTARFLKSQFVQVLFELSQKSFAWLRAPLTLRSPRKTGLEIQ